jgi:hypothetical protein
MNFYSGQFVVSVGTNHWNGQTKLFGENSFVNKFADWKGTSVNKN